MKNEICKLFVYGSLRSGFQHQAYEYLAQFFHLLGDAEVKGKLYEMGDYPVAVECLEEKFIKGELYELNNPAEFSWAIGQLDDYEGLNVEEGEISTYKRETVIVYHNNQQHIAWIYWYNGATKGLPVIDSGDVLQYLREQNKLP